jgi:hypothetical protein
MTQQEGEEENSESYRNAAAAIPSAKVVLVHFPFLFFSFSVIRQNCMHPG